MKNKIDIRRVGWNIRKLREERGMIQKELADLLGIDRTSLSAYETGKRVPDIYMLCKIADIFGISLDTLIGRKI